jgi:LCP family protein required for cell wall assembly
MSNRKVIIVAALLLVAVGLMAACQTADLQATQTFQTQVALNVQSTLTLAPTVMPPSDTPLPAPTDTPQPGPTETPGPTATLKPSATASPTARDIKDPTLQIFYLTPETTPVTAVPSAVPRIKQDDDVKNILLIGSDKEDANGGYRSDTMIIVSVNKTANTVTMLSIPRDLYVFIPKAKKVMGRINSVINIGLGADGGPIPLLEQTILYNLGIPIHYYARVDFDSFRNIVDALGGIDIPVTCRLEDYVLSDPTLDPSKKENWELYTIPTGLQHMDGDQALLYSRLRQSYRAYVSGLTPPSTPYGGIDFDRHRRQWEVLRAMFHKAREQNLLPQIPALYQEFSNSVDTDMTLGDILQFAQLGFSLNDLNIRSYSIKTPYVVGWTTPNDQAQVLLPVQDDFYKYVKQVMTAAGSNRVGQTPYAIEVWNGTTNSDWAQLASYELSTDTKLNVTVTVGSPDRTDYATTTIIDYTTSPKGSPLATLQKDLHVADANVIAQPDANSPVQFRVILGSDYNSCTYASSAAVEQAPAATDAPPIAAPEATATP